MLFVLSALGWFRARADPNKNCVYRSYGCATSNQLWYLYGQCGTDNYQQRQNV